ALSQLYLLQGQSPNAIRMTQAALQLEPKNETAIILHTQALHAEKGPAIAHEFITLQAKIHPKNAVLLQFYTIWLFDQGQEDKALQQMKQLSQMKTLTPKQTLQLANLCIEANWGTIAEELLFRIIDNKEQGNNAKYFLARLSETQNEINEAIKWYSKVLDGPFYLISQVRASILLAQQNQFKKALSHLDNLEPTEQEDVKRIATTKVEILMKAKNPVAALDILNHNLQFFPQDADLLYARSLVFETLKQIENAEQDLVTILAKNPINIEALNALGYILTEYTHRYDEASAYLQKAMDLSPNNPIILDSMGWLQYKLGHFEKAIKYLQNALAISPDPEIAAHLGEVLFASHKLKEAEKVFQNALELNPNNQNLLEAMHRLKEHKTQP
ncbi:MAG TPA: tetratricopeptide repeat protein, partial [Gammaproteobacteria bacterium]|nr:tetratricopeptide repeat protein [Gammaproteobacteria bacterium]